MLYREIGDNVIHDAPQSNEDILHMLTTIQLAGELPKEFGSATNSRFDCFIKELKELKITVKRGAQTHETLARKFPRICFQHPLIVARHIRKTVPDSRKPDGKDEYDDWIDVGRPDGLPLKVYLEWKKGKMYQASHEEWISRRAALRDMKNDMRNNNSLARKVYLAWVKGEIYKI